jgi:hypothetical protein
MGRTACKLPCQAGTNREGGSGIGGGPVLQIVKDPLRIIFFGFGCPLD